jgi:Flp pilus assembly protein TadG
MPLLMLICLGTIDLGRMFYGYVQMTNAVREGTTVASHEPDNWSEITTAIETHSSNLPAGYTWTCSACSSSTKAGANITITATWEFQPLTFDFLDAFWGLGDPVGMSTHSTMKVL